MNKTFAELGYNAGVTVRCVSTDRPDFYKVGEVFELQEYKGLPRLVSVSAIGSFDCSQASWELVSRAGSTDADDGYLIWSDMTPESQGALLLAFHNGATIQVFSRSSDKWLNVIHELVWSRHTKYRVKPADPVVVTHEVFGRHESIWVFFTDTFDTHTITYNTIDGVIDCASVKMMEIDK